MGYSIKLLLSLFVVTVINQRTEADNACYKRSSLFWREHDDTQTPDDAVVVGYLVGDDKSVTAIHIGQVYSTGYGMHAASILHGSKVTQPDEVIAPMKIKILCSDAKKQAGIVNWIDESVVVKSWTGDMEVYTQPGDSVVPTDNKNISEAEIYVAMAPSHTTKIMFKILDQH